MKPFAERTPDRQYQDILGRIMTEGREVVPIHSMIPGNKQGEKAKGLVGVQLRYNFQNGFPVIGDRNLFEPINLFRSALSEHIAFLHGARTYEELKKFGCGFWKPWVTKEKCANFGLEEGDLGPGSYGAAWHDFPTAEGQTFNQIEHFMKQITEKPYLRTHIITPWIPQYCLQHSDLKRKVVVAPCHGYIHALAYPDKKELVIHHFQRSGDFPVGVPFNIIQYAAFGLMVAKLTGYTMTELIHTFSDAHIYEGQYAFVEELLKREPKRLPTVTLKGEQKTIFDFTPDDFVLSDYDSHPAMRIPTPI